jgi:hypothetical protein
MNASPQELLLGARISGAATMLAPEARCRHLYIAGQTGTGKSTLLLNLIAQDLAAGAGLALLDPHSHAFELKIFFLTCVIVAGVYGGLTATRKILFVQALPALVALVAVHIR